MNQFTITTKSGTEIDVLNPDADSITIEDIASGLSRLPRYCGHTPGPAAYSVAQHSVLAAIYCMAEGRDREECLWALLHDGHEALGLGDVATPTKNALLHIIIEELRAYTRELDGDYKGAAIDPFKKWKCRMDEAVGHAFGFTPEEINEYTPAVKEVDALMLHHELKWRAENDGPVVTIPLMGTPVRFRVWRDAEARERFLQVFTALQPASDYSRMGAEWPKKYMVGLFQ